MWLVWGRRDFRTGFLREDLEEPGVDMNMILRWMLKKENGRIWIGSI